MRAERERDVERACCPCCGAGGALRVLASVWVRAWTALSYPVPGVEAGFADDAASAEWEANSPCECEACGFVGRVRDFTGEQDKQGEQTSGFPVAACDGQTP